MTKELAELLVNNGSDLRIYEDYSGRGMYGKTTTGIQCDDIKDFLDAVGETFCNMVSDASFEGEDYDMELADELKDLLTNHRQDSLGLGYIIY